MVPRYIDAVLEGGLKPNTSIEVKLDGGSLLAVDGQRGYGQVVGEQAMQLAIERAQATGSCVMALANAHHLGRIGHFAEMAVARGLVSIHFVNVQSRPVVAPFGAATAASAPTRSASACRCPARPPFVLDFATSRVAQGKMRVAHNEGRQVEPGYLIDEKGRPTTDPGVVVVPQPGGMFGALLPSASTRATAWRWPASCSVARSPAAAPGTARPTPKRAVINGMFTIVVDPAQARHAGELRASEALAFVDWLKQSPPAPEVAHDGRAAGRRAGAQARRQREPCRPRDGIALDDQTWAEIVLVRWRRQLALQGRRLDVEAPGAAVHQRVVGAQAATVGRQVGDGRRHLVHP
jgi:uncharacterized oxidoreductase